MNLDVYGRKNGNRYAIDLSAANVNRDVPFTDNTARVVRARNEFVRPGPHAKEFEVASLWIELATSRRREVVDWNMGIVWYESETHALVLIVRKVIDDFSLDGGGSGCAETNVQCCPFCARG